MIKKWKLLSSKTIFESPYITLFQEKLQKPDGSIVEDFYSVKRRDVVYIVALTESRKVPLVYQYKNGIKDLIWELPAGFIDGGEEPKKAATRELLEETGYQGEIFYLGGFVAAAGSTGNLNHFFFVDKAENVAEQKLDEHEDIEVKLFPLESLIKDIKSRKSFLLDSQSQFGLLLVWELLSNK